MRLTLVKCAWNPGNMGDFNDIGMHEFTYSIYPHKGDIASCDVVKYAYDLNLPMTAIKSEGKGNLPSEYSLVNVNTDNLVIETVKEAEYSSDTIVRMYETKNTRGKATVSFGFDVSEAYLANLSEKAERKLTVKDNKVSFEYKPFEIITLIVK